MARRDRILSEEQLDEMCELREAGKSIAAIAAHFTEQGVEISEGTIHWQCLRLGADLPPEKRGRSSPPSKTYMRNGKPVRPWTPEDDEKLLELEAAGTPRAKIGKILGRAPNSVVGRLYIFARREARAEEAA